MLLQNVSQKGLIPTFIVSDMTQPGFEHTTFRTGGQSSTTEPPNGNLKLSGVVSSGIYRRAVTRYYLRPSWDQFSKTWQIYPF